MKKQETGGSRNIFLVTLGRTARNDPPHYCGMAPSGFSFNRISPQIDARNSQYPHTMQMALAVDVSSVLCLSLASLSLSPQRCLRSKVHQGSNIGERLRQPVLYGGGADRRYGRAGNDRRNEPGCGGRYQEVRLNLEVTKYSPPRAHPYPPHIVYLAHVGRSKPIKSPCGPGS